MTTMSEDCEGCASKEAQIVFLANRAAAGQEFLNALSSIVDPGRVSLVELINIFAKRVHRIDKPTGLRVELDGKVLIEPEEKAGVHDHRDGWEKGPDKR